MRTWSNREKQRGVGLWIVLQMVMPDLARSLTTSTTCAVVANQQNTDQVLHETAASQQLPSTVTLSRHALYMGEVVRCMHGGADGDARPGQVLHHLHHLPSNRA